MRLLNKGQAGFMVAASVVFALFLCCCGGAAAQAGVEVADGGAKNVGAPFNKDVATVGKIEEDDTEYVPLCEYYPIYPRCGDQPGNWWIYTPGGYGIGTEFQTSENVTGWGVGFADEGHFTYYQNFFRVVVGWEAEHPPSEVLICPAMVPLGEVIQGRTLVDGLVVHRDSLGGLLQRFITKVEPLTLDDFDEFLRDEDDCLGFVDPGTNRLIYALAKGIGPVLAYLTEPLEPLMSSVPWKPRTYIMLYEAHIIGNRSCPGQTDETLLCGGGGEGEGEPIVNVIVPDVVGQLRDAARTAIAGARLTVGAVTLVFHATVPEGVVISQFPPAGVEVAEGTAVSVVVSLGVHMVTVPDVVGQAQGPAVDAIRGAELAVGGVTGQAHATIPAGVVISQEPGAGARVAPGTAVALVVSLGLQPVNVPDVVGLELAVASATLSSGSLSTGLVSELHHASAPAGRVISQNPAAGARVMPGTGVALVVSKGPQPVVVPNVVGRGRATAAGVIGDAALTVGEVSERYHETVAVGLVISQNPAAGTMVPPGTAVSFAASIGPPPVTVPDVAGQAESAASGMIVGAGLTVGSVTGQSHATVPAGRVISQYPAAGASAVSGSLVALVVSTGPQLVTVPNVAGRPQAEAQNTVTGAGLSMGTVTGQCSDTAAYGVVIGQTPAAGTEVAAGTAVNLAVSTGVSCETVWLGGIEGNLSPPPGVAQTYTVIGAGSSAGHPVEYQFSFNDGTAASPWSASPSVSHIFVTSGLFKLTARVRCASHPLLTATGVWEIRALSADKEGCGCGCTKSDFSPDGLKNRLGDLFLAGLALGLLAAGRVRRP